LSEEPLIQACIERPKVGQVSSFLRLLDQTERHITGGTPLDEWSAGHRALYLTTHQTNNRQTSIPPAGFELTISAGELPQTYALNRAVARTACSNVWISTIWNRSMTKLIHSSSA